MLIVDRFEGDFAVCELSSEENGTTQILIEKEKLPLNVKEGDVITAGKNGYEIDNTQTEKRREKIKNLQNSLWE